MGNKFGWHSGVLTCKDAKIQGDLYVQDDIVFSDVSAGVLGVTGGIDMTGTTSAIGISLTGGTFSTGAIMCGTGTSARQTMAEAEDFVLGIYTTCADTDGSNTAKPLYVNAQYSGAGQVARAAEFVLYPTAKLGGWANALKAYTDFSGDNDGGTTGLASSACLEMKLPNGACNGAFYPLEIEWVGQTSTSFSTPGSGSASGFMILNASGTVTDFDDEGVFFSVNGLTAAADHLLSANSQTLKVDIGSGTTRYMLLSQLQDALSLDSCATAITLGDNVTTTGIQIGNVPTGILLDGSFTTGISMVGGVSYNPIHIGTKSNTHSNGLILTGATDDTGGVMIFADDGNATLGSVTSPIWTRYLITKNQGSGGPTATGMFAQTKTLTGLTFATGSYTAFKAYLQVGGTLVLNGNYTEVGIINAGVTFEGDLTVTNGTFSGIDVNINDGTNTLGTTSGIIVRKTASSTAGWTYGLNIADSGATTGIEIGDCTKGINFSGTLATAGIDFGSSTVTLADNRTNSFIRIGNYAGTRAPIVISDLTKTFAPVQMHFDIQATDDGAQSFRPLWCWTEVSTKSQTDLSIYGFMHYVELQQSVSDAYGALHQIVVSSSAASTVAGRELHAIQGTLEVDTGKTITNSGSYAHTALNASLKGAGTFASGTYGIGSTMEGTATAAGLLYLRASPGSTIDHAWKIGISSTATVNDGLFYLDDQGDSVYTDNHTAGTEDGVLKVIVKSSVGEETKYIQLYNSSS